MTSAGDGPHVVVVGAGIVGAATAYELTRLGARVTIVEQDVPAAGATGSSFGWVGRHGRWPGGAADLRDHVLPQWRRLEQEVPGVRVRWSGSLSWPPGHHPVGEPPEADADLLGAAEVRTLEPALRRPPEAAVHVPGDAAVDAGAVTRALVAAAVAGGARLLTGVEARLDVSPGGARVLGVATDRGPIAADHVVVAAGAGTRVLCAAAGVDVPVAASPATLLRFRAPSARAPSGRLRAVLSCPELEVRADGDGSLLVSAADGDPSPAHLDALATATAARIRATLRGTDDLRLEAATVGPRPMPADGAPIVGPAPGVAGLFVVVAHSGVCLAPVLGREVAREVVTGAESALLRRCRFGR
ncbi:NAD(P)/FAD-dependent oxidoreductase [Kineococcus rubinsiae]|uniref:NAD(P)/FAD-dependent oxidoreductase n=1 Tax=Kineococcus rubinsiae TaxID=2609562 RepID=UPI001431BD85|nr:FAD-binding oxidoreductase [Kineococcus rubinsiae]